ncbi:hypothetical protein SPI_06471 [Niveomyces insectorum RCEF 264]|uniref:Fun14 family protein n=1 Tax=Niveomyces insectorum RCEF 264 TaxID=1081102 RepID=A0A167R9Y4_9HYPO|nr:hypothetical protein SPI_06471 [Niveomyces insectorum RCEF 264]
MATTARLPFTSAFNRQGGLLVGSSAAARVGARLSRQSHPQCGLLPRLPFAGLPLLLSTSTNTRALSTLPKAGRQLVMRAQCANSPPSLWLRSSNRRFFRFSSPSSTSSSSSSSYTASHSWWLAAVVPFVPLVPEWPKEEQNLPPRDVSPTAHNLPLDPNVAAQISEGSVIGFLLGLLVSTFSKTLVLLLGTAITLQSMASRVGIDLAHYLKPKQRITYSKVLDFLRRFTAFKLAFGITFIMAAFMHF